MFECCEQRLNTEQNAPLYRVLANHLRTCIQEGKLKVGNRLPTSRELQRRFHLSSSTVEHGIKLLVREGWLLRRPRRGTFINHPPKSEDFPKSERLRIKVLFSNIRVGGEHWYRVLFFIEEYLREHNAELLFERQDLSNPTANASKIMNSSHGAILCGTNPISLAEYLLEHKFPFIMIGAPDRKNHSLKKMDVYIGDDEARMIKAVKTLFDMGHRDIAAIYAPEDSMFGQELKRGLKKSAKMFNLERHLQVYPLKVASVETGHQIGCRILCQEKRPTAILSSDIMVSIGILHAVNSLGFSVPEDLSILSCGSDFFAEFCNPPLTTLGEKKDPSLLLIPFREMMDRLFDQIYNPNHQATNLINRDFEITFRRSLIYNKQQNVSETKSNLGRKDQTT